MNDKELRRSKDRTNSYPFALAVHFGRRYLSGISSMRRPKKLFPAPQTIGSITTTRSTIKRGSEKTITRELKFVRNQLLFTFIFLVTTCFGQVDSLSIYSSALNHYNSHLNVSKIDTNEIFIESNNGITEKLPKQIGNRKVTILTWENQESIYKKNNNKIRHVKIFPARINGDLVEVSFTPYFGEYKGKKKGYHLAVSDWVTIQFKFDCAENKFKYWKTVTGGI